MSEQMNPQEIWNRMKTDPVGFVREATTKGVPFSRHMEHLNPSDQEDLDRGYSAFARVAREAGFVTRSLPEEGVWATDVGEFLKPDHSDISGRRALVHEFALRQARKAAYAKPTQRALLSTDSTAGTWARPYAEAAQDRWDQQIAPAVPLNEIVAMTNPVSAADYRALYLTYDAEQLRMYRVGESAEIPLAKITESENSIRLHKYGRGIEASYEALRRVRVDKFARMIQLAMVQNEVDKVAAALSVLINGDGNSNGATTDDLTTLDGDATAGTLTLAGWLAWKKQWDQPYMITTALMTKAVAQQLELLNTGSANIPQALAGLGNMAEIRRINQTGDAVGYGWLDSAPTLKIVGFDKRFALEQLVEVGSNITETENYVSRQTNAIFMSEVQGFAIMDANATRILDVNA